MTHEQEQEHEQDSKAVMTLDTDSRIGRFDPFSRSDTIKNLIPRRYPVKLNRSVSGYFQPFAKEDLS